MITSRTKKQLIIFVLITLVGVSYVGARYARLDKLVYDSSYKVNAQFNDSGGIFTGAEVTYRGVKVGAVSDMQLTKSGVNVILDIDKGQNKIPASTIALVGNKSAVGEQFVELDPKVDGGPYLKAGSVIQSVDTQIPISTSEILTNLDQFVLSVPQGSLRTVVSELGSAFKGTGTDVARLIDTSNAFLKTANDNFDITTALIRDSNKVLQTQADKGSAIRSFSQNLALFSGVVADNDAALRTLIDSGSATANELKTFLEQNGVDLGQLINKLVTTGEVVVKHLPGIRQILVLYPYLVAGAYGVVAKNSAGYNARFGLILNQMPGICSKGYTVSQRRSPSATGDKPMDPNAHCAEPAATTNARGAQNAPRTATGYSGDQGSSVATYDLNNGTTAWNNQASASHVAYDGGASELYGDDAWQTLLLQPMT